MAGRLRPAGYIMRRPFRLFRNVTAQVPRVEERIGEQGAMDLFTLASDLHRRLDSRSEDAFAARSARGGDASAAVRPWMSNGGRERDSRWKRQEDVALSSRVQASGRRVGFEGAVAETPL